ncbi:hypothetical protein BH10PSE16_BH10PSE16_06720 [soil metagenome]
MDVLQRFPLMPMESRQPHRYSEFLSTMEKKTAMPKDSSRLTDASALNSVRNSPALHEMSVASIVKLPSRWPFTVEGSSATMNLSPADSAPIGSKEKSSFIT